MAFHLQHSWLPLVGQRVIIKYGAAEVRRGAVDAVTEDDQVLWVSADGAEDRRLFERAEGFRVWIDSSGRPRETVKVVSRRPMGLSARLIQSLAERPEMPSVSPASPTRSRPE